MGLDFVEVVICVEEEFGVLLPDAEVSKCTTVGDFVALATKAVADREAPAECGFRTARQLLVEHIGIPAEEVRSDAMLSDIVPLNRRHLWCNIVAEDRRIPKLTALPMGEFCLKFHLILSIALLLPCLLASILDHPGLAWIFGTALVLLLVVRRAFAQAYRVHFPAEIQTVGDLTRRLSPDDWLPQGSDVSARVQEYVFWTFAAVGGCRPSSISLEMRLSELE